MLGLGIKVSHSRLGTLPGSDTDWTPSHLSLVPTLRTLAKSGQAVPMVAGRPVERGVRVLPRAYPK